MKVGIDNYGLLPLGLCPMEILEWAVRKGAEGVAFSGIGNRPQSKYPKQILLELKNYALDNQLFMEWGGGQHLPWDIEKVRAKEIFSFNKIVAEEAAELGIHIVRSCSGGLMRWHDQGPKTPEYLDGMQIELEKLKTLVSDLGIVWAVETHFEFTSFELIRVFEKAGIYPGEGIGICLDTMNLLTMLEDPVEATKRLLPWIVSTHIKDGGILTSPNGLRSFPAPINSGWINLKEIIRLISERDNAIHLNVEDHNGFFELPLLNDLFLKEFPDLQDNELESLVRMGEIVEPYRKKIEIEYFDRDLWPSVCEQRMKQNIVELISIRNSIEND